MSLYDNLLESVIYEDSVEEYKERISLQEKYNYTREQLSDPNTIKKIYKDFKENKEKKNIYDRIGVGLSIIMIILALPTLGIAPFILAPLLMKLFDLSLELPLKKKNQAIKELKVNANKLIDKLNKEISKTSDKETQKQLQKEIDNIRKVLNEIDKKENDIENKKKESELNEYIKLYQDAIKEYKNPFYMEVHPQHGDNYDFQMLYIINNCANMEIFVKRCKKIYSGIYIGDNKIIELNDGTDKNIEVIFYDDNEATTIYYLKNKDLFVITKFRDDNIEKGESAVINYFKKVSTYISDYEKEMIKEADKELGYYLLSKAPAGIKPKANPFK